MDLLERFKKELSRFDIVGRTVRIALSGGVDSIALAELLLRTAGDLEIAAVHIVHGIRENGDADAEFVRDYCRNRKIPLETERVDAPEYAEKRNVGIEEAARELRYDAFRKYTERGEIVATGHNANDVVETMLFNLVRGSGPRGLAGIPRKRDGIIRPLLPFWRHELEHWLRERNQRWREDESNRDLRFSRNRIRWMLIPELKRVFGEGVIERLRRETDIFSACAEFIGEQGAIIAETASISELGNISIIDKRIATKTVWGFGEIIRNILESRGTGLSTMNFDSIERLHGCVTVCRKGRRFPVGSGLHIESGERLLFIFDRLPEIGTVPIDPPATAGLPAAMGSITISEKGEGIPVNYDESRLILRLPVPGDRIDPKHKLRRSLARKGIPRILRDIVPLVFSGNTPIFHPLLGAIKTEPGLFRLKISLSGPITRLSQLYNGEPYGKRRDT